MKRILWVLLLLGVAALLVSYQAFQRWTNQSVVMQDHVFEVPRGASALRIAQLLQQQTQLQYPRLWAYWVRQQKVGHLFKAGEYQLTKGMSPRQLIALLTSGQVILHSMTIVEGSTFADLRGLLRARDDIEQTIATQSDAQVMTALGASALHPEGRFFPDTYRFARGIRDIEILKMAFERMQRELRLAWEQRDPALSLNSADEALILASIVEKESALASERPVIAGVFLERLERNMKLQTDPTVIYGLGASYDGNIRKDDLLRDTPYNTYTRVGLPPTPICLPGLAALRAAMNPERTGALFFVATGHADGSHFFSRTLDEHNAAVQRYLKVIRGR